MNRKIRGLFNWTLSKLYPTDEIKAEMLSTFRYGALYFIALLYWELLLRSQIGFKDMTFYFIFFLPSISMFLATLTGWFKNKLLGNRIVTPIVMVLPFAFYVSQLVYYRIFGSLFSVSMMGVGGDAMKDFGWALWDTIKDSVLWIILCLLPVLAAIAYAYCAPKKIFKGFSLKMHVVSLCKTVVLWLLAVLMLLPFGTGDFSPYHAYSSSLIDTDTASSRLGVLTNSIVELGYKLFGGSDKEENTLVIPDAPEEPSIDTTPNVIDGLDFAKLKLATTDAGKQKLCDYFAALSGTNKNEYTGSMKDYNLIYICAEAFSCYAIDETVTPTLYKMSQGGIVLNNFYNSFKNTTTNGEYAFMTGLWPDVSRVANANSSAGSFVQSKTKLLPFSLGNMFEGNGIKTHAFHNFRGYYYQRNKTHPNLGYTSLKFMGQGMNFTSSWPSSDLEMMEQSIDDYINQDQFHAYYMTFSGHGPYSNANPIAVKNYNTVNELLGERELTWGAKYYLAANYELEKAMTYLLDRLETAGKLDKTMIVIIGDHYPYYLADNHLNSLAGKTLEGNFEKYKSSCIMYCPGIERVEIDQPVCNVDILPTVLNLWGMNYDSRLLPGTDIFSNNTHIAMLYNKSFVTEYVKYNAQTGAAEWLPTADKLTDDEKQKHLNYCVAVTKSRYSASLDIMNEDFYRFVMDNIEVKAPEDISSNESTIDQ